MTEQEILASRQLFIVTFVVDEPPPPNGQQPQPPRAINLPAFVTDWNKASERAREFVAAFSATPEAKQVPPNAKIKLQTISIGGTILI